MELVQPQHIHINRLLILPNAWWFPYGTTAIETFKDFAKYFASGSKVQTAKMMPQLLKRLRELIKK
jgi:hypothetical protein